MDYDAIIIGGGLGGLSAGAILARKGKKVLLLEQHYVPGGCATTFKRKDFLMEAGLHAMDGHLIDETKNHSLLRFLGIMKHLDFQPLPEFFHIQNSRIDFTFPNDSEQAIEALIKAYPDQEKGIRKFFKLILGVQDELSRFPGKAMEKAWKFPLFPILFPNILKTFRRNLGWFLDRYFTNEDLKLILQGNLVYYHDDPYSMSMVFFAKAQASFIHHGGYFVKGGSQKLSDSLASVIQKNQGCILLGKSVNQILLEGKKAVGVSFRDAFNPRLSEQKVYAPSIIHSGAVPLVKNLLTGSARDLIVKKTEGLTPSCSLFCIYIGFSGEIGNLTRQHYSTFIYGDNVHSLKHVQSNNNGSWLERNFVFVDYSLIDSGLAPKGKSFGAICSADKLSDWEGLDENTYKIRKQEVADIMLDRLEKAFPGITLLIESYEVATSRTIKRYTKNPHAAPYGYAQTPSQAGFKRPSYQSPVKNLWFSGNWTFPGGGFTGALVSGFLCGLKVNEKLDKKGIKTESIVFNDQRIVRLLSKKEIADSSLELTFEKPEDFEFQPGQYVYLSLNDPAHTEMDVPVRPLSIASHPDADCLSFIMRKSKSSFKQSCEALQTGERATIYGPAGTFTLNPSSLGIVFLVSGIGISPLIPMLEELKKRSYEGPVCLISSNREESGAVFHEQLKEPGLKNYTYIPVFTGKEKRITAETLKKIPGERKELEYYIVGTSSFLCSMTEMLEEYGIGSKQIYTDNFG